MNHTTKIGAAAIRKALKAVVDNSGYRLTLDSIHFGPLYPTRGEAQVRLEAENAELFRVSGKLGIVFVAG